MVDCDGKVRVGGEEEEGGERGVYRGGGCGYMCMCGVWKGSVCLFVCFRVVSFSPRLFSHFFFLLHLHLIGFSFSLSHSFLLPLLFSSLCIHSVVSLFLSFLFSHPFPLSQTIATSFPPLSFFQFFTSFPSFSSSSIPFFSSFVSVPPSFLPSFSYPFSLQSTDQTSPLNQLIKKSMQVGLKRSVQVNSTTNNASLYLRRGSSKGKEREGERGREGGGERERK